MGLTGCGHHHSLFIFEYEKRLDENLVIENL